jgi:hypothetical protein
MWKIIASSSLLGELVGASEEIIGPIASGNVR